MESQASVTGFQPAGIQLPADQVVETLPLNKSHLFRDFFLLTYGGYTTEDISSIVPEEYRVRPGFGLTKVRRFHVPVMALAGAAGGDARLWAFTAIYCLPFGSLQALGRAGELRLACILLRYTVPVELWVEVIVYARVTHGNWLFVGVSEGQPPSLAYSGLVAACEQGSLAFARKNPGYVELLNRTPVSGFNLP